MLPTKTVPTRTLSAEVLPAGTLPAGVLPAGTRTETFDALARMASGEKPLPGCPVQSLKARLHGVGLRPTRQRILLGWLLFSKGHRHVSAEELYDEATRARAHLSLATVYNTLRQFSEAQLIRQVPSGGGKAFFDTNVDEHHHYLAEGEDRMWDAPNQAVTLAGEPVAPPGYAVVGVDVIVRLKRLDGAQ
jgi:Fur family transcriptional regulator, iron response regulator